MADVSGLLDDLRDVPVSIDEAAVRRASRDMSAVLSPALAEVSAGLVADAVVSPRDEDELVRVVAACAAHRVPLVPRGAGTCNFGQGVPLAGGVVLDVTALRGLVDSAPGTWRARTGTVLADVDLALWPRGEELRVFPSSKRVGTVGGFVVGGHAGIGAVRHGVLADEGNILGLRVLTVEESPRVLEVRGEDVNLVHFSFGTAGIVTEVEMPTTRAWPWRDVAVSFGSFSEAVDFGHAVALADGLDVKVVQPVDAVVARSFTPLGLTGPAAICMVAPHSLEGLRVLAARRGGSVVVDVAHGEGPRGIPFYEFTWGHSIWWLRKVEPGLATMLALLPEADPVGALSSLTGQVDGRAAVSVKRFAGRPALQVALAVSAQDLARAADVASDLGFLVADTHRPVLSGTSLYGFADRQRAFARDVDPYGLLNPGKVADDDLPEGLRASGFSSRRS